MATRRSSLQDRRKRLGAPLAAASRTPARQITYGLLAALSTVAVTLAAPVATAQAAEVRVVVAGLRSDAGSVLVALCPEEAFLASDCGHSGRAPARTGAVLVGDVPPGVYAVQAFHDENDNGRLDRSGLQRPAEGIGFSRDAAIRFGPPRFADASVEVREPGEAVTVTMRYFP